MAEVWWNRGADVVAFLESDAAVELLENLRRLQEEIMDLPNCTFFFASEDA